MEIIASYVPSEGADPVEELRRPPNGATMVELRADLLPQFVKIGDLVAASPLPVVLTLRSRSEGGRGPDGADERRSFFASALGLPVAFFDLEAVRDIPLLESGIPRERVILSRHFVDVPSDLEEQAKACLELGTRFVKLVATANDLADALRVVSLCRAFEHGDRGSRRGIVFASGEPGRLTRLLGPLLGAAVAYAAWSDDRPAAAGQLSALDLRSLTGHLGGRPRRLYGVVGTRVSGSLSPRMHAAAYRAMGLPNLMVPIEVGLEAELDELIAPLGASCFDSLGLPLGGLAVTMPWKGAAARRCALLAPRAERCAAVNTVIPRPGKILGDCTDIDGINGVLRDAGVDPRGLRAMVLGTGGAARAAAVGLQLAGAEVAIGGRNPDAARRLAEHLAVAVSEPSGSVSCDVIVNATPAGREGETDGIIADVRAPEGAVVIDLPYAVGPTGLEVLAARNGWHYIGGREVLLFQGISQFAAMNQVAPPVTAMAAALGLEEIQA